MGVWHWLRSLTGLLLKLETLDTASVHQASLFAVFEQQSRFTAASIAIITTDTGETQAPKVGNETLHHIHTTVNGGRALI